MGLPRICLGRERSSTSSFSASFFRTQSQRHGAFCGRYSPQVLPGRGGFGGRRFVRDTELWLKLAERWPVVLLPPALVWWRRHEGQQMSLEMKKPEVLNVRFRLQLEVLRSTVNLATSDRTLAEQRLVQHHARRLLAMAIREGRIRTAWKLWREAPLRYADLIKGLRSYQ